MFYLSAYIEDHREEYIQRLRALGKEPHAWDGWIRFFLQALDAQARANAAKARAIMDLYETMKNEVLTLTHSQYAVPLLDRIFQHPIFRSSDISFQDDHAPSRQAVSQLLRTLRIHGIVKVLREGSGRRPQVFAFVDLINLCEGGDVL